MTPEELRLGLRSVTLDDQTADEIVFALEHASKAVDLWMNLDAGTRGQVGLLAPELSMQLWVLTNGPQR